MVVKNKTSVEWIESWIVNIDVKFYSKEFILRILKEAKEMEAKQIYETKQRWFGKGILAGRENRISELKPKK